jgi:hypothetical protein
MQHAEDLLEQAPAAWRRPGVVFVMYAYRLVVALLVATPFALMFGAAVGGYPRGDAVLFDEGGLLFVEAIRRSNSAIPPIVASALVLLAVASFASIVPLAALIGALATKGRIKARDVGAFALRPVGTFALLFGAVAFVQAIVFAIFSGIGGAISRRPSFDAPSADRVKLGFTIVALIVVLLIGVFHDLARVAVVRDELRFRAALRRGWQTIKKSHVHVLGAWGVRAILGAIVIYAALSVVSRLGVDSKAKVALGFLVYQASIILALFLRASWFASAIRHVDRARPLVAPEVALEPEPMHAESLLVEPSVPEVAVAEAPEVASLPTENPPNDEAASALVDNASPGISDTADNLDARA